MCHAITAAAWHSLSSPCLLIAPRPHLAIVLCLVGLQHSVMSIQWQCCLLWWLKQVIAVTRTGITQKVSQRACLSGVILNRLTQTESPALTVGGTFPRAKVSVWINNRKWAEHQHSLYPGLDWRCSVTNCFKLLLPWLPHRAKQYPWTVSKNKPFRS